VLLIINALGKFHLSITGDEPEGVHSGITSSGGSPELPDLNCIIAVGGHDPVIVQLRINIPCMIKTGLIILGSGIDQKITYFDSEPFEVSDPRRCNTVVYIIKIGIPEGDILYFY